MTLGSFLASRRGAIRLGTIAVLALAATPALAGCGGGNAPVDDGRSGPLGTLTAVALGTVPADDAAAPTAAAGIAVTDTVPSDTDALATTGASAPLSPDDYAATLVAESNEGLPPMPTPGVDELIVDGANAAQPGGQSPESAEEQARTVRQTAEAKSQIANVDELVSGMPPLATFTPQPKAPSIGGSLLFVRGGDFYQAAADGSNTRKLALENSSMPSVWSPPDDPGRAWPSDDGKRVAFLAGNEAGLWIMDTDGKNGRQAHANTLPNEVHKVTIGGFEQDVKLRPGSDYTLVLSPGGASPIGVLVDNNDYHKHGEARVRIVHAARGLADTVLLPVVNGDPLNRAAYGRASGENAFAAPGPLKLEVRAQSGGSLATFDDLTVADREVKTLFVYGEKNAIKVHGVTYESGTRPGAGKARVRIFNASATPVDLVIDGQPTVVRGVAEGQLSPYAEAQGTMAEGELEDMRIDIYGLRAGEVPIVWSPDGKQVAFLSGETGQHDLWVAGIDGKARQLTNDVSREINPLWSPDSKHLLWQSLDTANQTLALVVQPAAGGAASVVDTAPIRAAERVPADKQVTFAETLGWADAGTVYFAPRTELVTRGIWTYGLATKKVAQVYDGALNGLTWSEAANAWAFHGAAEVWVAGQADAGGVFIVDRAGKVTRLVERNAFFPQWSPDGKSILFGEGLPMDGTGWRMNVIGRDGKGQRALTEKLPLMQTSPPVPGPNFKVTWSRDGKTVVFSRVGKDYGLKDRVGVVGALPAAGDDIENLYAVPIDGRTPPVQLTDLTKAFYLNEAAPSPDGRAYAFIGFTYLDRSQRLLVIPNGGGKPVSIDTPVRWFQWVP